MGEKVLLNNMKKAAVMTVKATEKTLVVGTVVAKEGHKHLKEGATLDEKSNLMDIKDLDDTVINHIINKSSKSAEKYNKEVKKIKKEIKAEKKDIKKLNKEVRNKFGLEKKDVKSQLEHFKENKEIYKTRIGPPTERERNFIKLVDKNDSKKVLQKTKNATKIKALKRQGAATALKAKRELKNDLRSGSSLSSDNLRESGSKSLAGAVNRAINRLLNPIEHLKKHMAMLISSIVAQIMSFMLPFLAGLIAVACVVAIVVNTASSILGFFGIGGDSTPDSQYVVDDNVGFDDSTIEALIQERRDKYDLTPEQEQLLRFAFGQVGGTYVFGAKGNGAYDCSGFAYAAEEAMGKSIADDCAAAQCKQLSDAGKVLLDTSSEPQIGDLIYARRPNSDYAKDRWNQVGHVYVYVGNGYVVHAASSDRGIVYEKVKPNDAFMICRP